MRPIPLSRSVVWRTVRSRVVPVIVFFGVLAILIKQWQSFAGGGIPGIAEGVRSTVTSPHIGLLQEVKVRPYQWIEAGQPVAVLLPKDPRAKLDLLQTELQIARLRMEPSQADQNALDYERLRVDSLRLQEEVATAEVELKRAQNSLTRYARLREEKLVSEETYDLSLRDRDTSQVEIIEKNKAIAMLESRLAALRNMGEPEFPGDNRRLQAITDLLDEKVLAAEAEWRPVTLLAPISGIVHVVNRQSGEFVQDCEPLITINSTRSDRIVGYLRQPYAVEPELGMKVQVLTRARHPRKFQTHISQIGAHVETLTNSLAFLRPGVLVDAALPFVVEVPENVNIRPGEAVDILLLSRANGSEANSGAEAGERPALSSLQ